jgi:hypothetical protein
MSWHTSCDNRVFLAKILKTESNDGYHVHKVQGVDIGLLYDVLYVSGSVESIVAGSDHLSTHFR